LALGDDHGHDLPTPGDEIGQKPCLGVGQRPDRRLGRLDEVGDDAGSIGSVLARLPNACAKERTWAGFTTTTANPAAERLAATTVSYPPPRQREQAA